MFDRQREHEKLLDVASKVNGEFNKKGIQELYAQLMSMSRKLQYQQLVEAGALGRLSASYFRVWKELIVRLP